MSDQNLNEIENVEVEALTENELEEVAGGLADVCSVSRCSNGSTTQAN